MSGFSDAVQSGVAGTSTIDDDADPSVLFESSDGSNQIRIKTTDDAEAVTFLDDHTTGVENASPKHESSGFVGIRCADPKAPLHIMGQGGKTSKSWDPTADDCATVIIENGNAHSKDRLALAMNGQTQSKIKFYVADSEKMEIHADASSQKINGGDSLDLQTAGNRRLNIASNGSVAVGSAVASGTWEFEVNGGGQYWYIDVSGSDTYLVGSSVRSLYYGGGSANYGMLLNKYGGLYRMSMGSIDAAIANSTAGDQNDNSAVYLDESSTSSGTYDTLVIDYLNGSCGAVTLTHDIAHIKFFNAPKLGIAQSMTVKIINNASAAKTIDWSSSVNVYSNAGVTTKNGSLLWSGGVDHTLSTGTGDIDVISLTCIATSDTDRDIYGAVIGQDFS